LAGELEDLRGTLVGDLSGDAADAAFEAGSGEITSQLAQLEARELAQVERALQRLKHGAYGVCEGCAKKINVTRLNALPYSTYCIECQREMERNPGWEFGRGSDWEKVYDSARHSDDQPEIDISAIEMDLSGSSR
jgi:DnaK suppressor protein